MIGLCKRNSANTLLWLLVSTSIASVGYCQGRTQEELTVPDPETLTVNASDGVPIRCSYYAGGFVETAGDKKDKPKVEKNPGKEVVPVILLHGWDGRRREFDDLATTLQKRGHAIIVPDLRGHGDSTTVTLPNGDVKNIERDRMRSSDIAGMVLDVEACKKFLLDKNNEGELNIEMLCVVGAEVGATVAVNWAAYDWNRRQLPAFKQGRDVKALVLVSPKASFKGFSLQKALAHPIIQKTLSVMLIVGEGDRSAASATKKIHLQLERMREDPPENPEERMKKQDLFYLKPNTTLQGTRLVNVPSLPLKKNIGLFIDLRLVRNSDSFPWMERKSPLGTN